MYFPVLAWYLSQQNDFGKVRPIIEEWDFVKSISETVGLPNESQRIFITVKTSDLQIEVEYINTTVDYIYIELPKQTVNHYIDELGDPVL